MRFLVYLYYMQPFYWTSTFGQNHAYCIRIFMVDFKTMETQGITDCHLVQGCVLSEQSYGAVFWDMTGVLLVEFQEHVRTVNTSSYRSLLERLKIVMQTKHKRLLTQGVILLHDSARLHVRV